MHQGSAVSGMSVPELVRFVSRGSPMALSQVERVRAEPAAVHPGVRTEVVPVRTTGDRYPGEPSKVEGRGAFTKEVDAAPPAGTVFAAFLRRDDVRDALVHPGGLALDELPAGTRIGTSAVRRRCRCSPCPVLGASDGRM